MKKNIFVMMSAIVLASCGGDKKETTTTTTEEKPTSMVQTETTTPAGITVNGNTVEVALVGTDDMKYNISEIKVKAGQKIKLTLKAEGKLPKTAMAHNFVLLASGTDVPAFAMEAMKATTTDYIADADKAKILAHTKLLAAGESDTVEFDAPAAGTYDYICTFPGHYTVMHGKFIVE